MTTNRQKLIELAALSDRIFHELAIHRHNAGITRTLKQWKAHLMKVDSRLYWPIVEQHNLTMLAVTLCKVIELHSSYRGFMPERYRERMDRINADIIARQVIHLRNKYCGHILDRRTGRPISTATRDSLITKLIGGRSWEEVESWFWCVTGDPEDGSIGGTLQAMRDELIQTHRMSPEELAGAV